MRYFMAIDLSSHRTSSKNIKNKMKKRVRFLIKKKMRGNKQLMIIIQKN